MSLANPPQPPHGKLRLCDDANAMAAEVAVAVQQLSTTQVRDQGIFRIALSGGSTPQRLYQLLAQMDLPWQSIEWYWGDERNVPHDHPESNYRMVNEALLHCGKVPSELVFPVPINVDDPAATAQQYEATLRRQFGAKADESSLPAFDLVLLGMGDDAHTASLFPETTALSINDRLFVENWVPKFSTYRLTITAPLINAAQNVWFLIAGANKQTALRQVWGDQQEPTLYPSQLVHPSPGELCWWVSRDAILSDKQVQSGVPQ